jgi:hypothetical protein
MAGVNWNNNGGLPEGAADSAEAARELCDANERCYAWNDAGYWLMVPSADFEGFYPYPGLCTYVKRTA